MTRTSNESDTLAMSGFQTQTKPIGLSSSLSPEGYSRGGMNPCIGRYGLRPGKPTRKFTLALCPTLSLPI